MEMGRRKRQRKPVGTEEDAPNLPCEVIYKILSKLPVKSLMRFRCVCKPWRAEISEPQFIKTHLSEAIKSDRHRLVYMSCKSKCFYLFNCGEPDKEKEENTYFAMERYWDAPVLCSCDGLVLLSPRFDTYVLWNPSTKVYKTFRCPHQLRWPITFYGLFYDSLINDYKLVAISTFGSDRNFYMVYTFKTNSWTDIREFPYSILFRATESAPNRLLSYNNTGVCIRRSGVIVNGAPHWVVNVNRYKNNNNNNTDVSSGLISLDRPKQRDYYRHHPCLISKIVYYDLVADNFKEVVPPPNDVREGDIFTLTVLEGCLSICLKTSNNRFVEVWVMKEYGERNSWAKLFKIPCKLGSTVLNRPTPYFVTNKGEVVVSCLQGVNLLIYNPQRNKLRKVKHSEVLVSSTVSFVDSLVLP